MGAVCRRAIPVACFALALFAGVARAEAPAEVAEPESRQRDAPLPSPEDGRAAPPGEESGIVTDERHPGRHLLWVPRALLLAPEMALRLATEPIRLLARLEDRTHFVERAREFFFNDAHTFGIYPSFFFQTGFGVNGGLQLVHRDLFGKGERLAIGAGFGGLNRQIYTLSFHTGARLAPLRLGVDLGFQAANRYRFYTIGNVDAVQASSVTGLLDAQSADVAVRSRYEVRELWVQPAAQVALGPRVVLSFAERIRHRSFGTGSGTSSSTPWITDVYAPQSLVGFEDQADATTELHLGYRGTRSTLVYVPGALPTEGLRFDVWGGYQQGLDNPFRFGRAGFDVQGFIPLFSADRVLRLRLRASGVIGEDARIPLVDLPSLGGRTFLRGYQRNRFRDRLAIVSTAEYRFPIGYRVSGFLFVDAGRVYHGLSDLSFAAMRVGYGGGLLMSSKSSFLSGLQLARSIAGGFFVSFLLSTTDALGAID